MASPTVLSSSPEMAGPPVLTPWFRRDGTRAAIVAALFHAVLTMYGYLTERLLAGPLAATSTARYPRPLLSPISHTERWDALWLQGVAEGSYARDPQSAAFYPLFPGLARGVSEATGLDLLLAGLLVNVVATGFAVYALLRIGRSHLPGRWAWLLVGLFLTTATAYFLHAFYSEAVFCALSFGAYAFARERRWAPMGLCLILAGTSRVTAVLVVGLCFLEFCRAYGWRPRAVLRPALLWFPASLLGFAGYALALRIVTGDAFAMFSGYGPGRHWAFNVFTPNVPETLAGNVVTAWDAVTGATPLTATVLADSILPLLALAVLLATSVHLLVALRADGIPLAALGIASFLMFTLNGNLIAVHRYTLPCLSIYVSLSLLAAHRWSARPFVAALALGNVLLQGLMFALFAANLWTG
ncbi:hypothetical protein [Pseudonocardia pini]|uniref:hypothetical protein n=1 Tax=Pseudonocardia pini TaxID=2758030 RepID=UPI0015F0CA89|nr:hypothetical protein [Pseudonocardia pini]